MFIISHPSLMYQNRDGVPGTEYHAPDGVINLVINAAQPTFTVTYTVNGEFYAEQTYAAGDAVNAPEYNPEEGFVLVDKNPCIKINFYQKSTHRYQATYLISSDGTHIYQLNRESDKVTELSL